MSRLLDPTRGPKEYSLSNTTAFYKPDILNTKQNIINRLK